MNKAQIRAIIALPTMVIGVFPALVLIFTGQFSLGWGFLSPFDIFLVIAGVASAVAGAGMMSITIRQFATIGDGTLAPWDPPKHLVVVGIYRYVRNPMITGVLLVSLGESLIFGNVGIMILFCLFLIANLLYIPLSEEPGLQKRFGDEYTRYKQNVPRWIPRRTPWDPESQESQP